MQLLAMGYKPRKKDFNASFQECEPNGSGFALIVTFFFPMFLYLNKLATKGLRL